MGLNYPLLWWDLAAAAAVTAEIVDISDIFDIFDISDIFDLSHGFLINVGDYFSDIFTVT